MTSIETLLSPPSGTQAHHLLTTSYVVYLCVRACVLARVLRVFVCMWVCIEREKEMGGWGEGERERERVCICARAYVSM